MRGKPQTYIFRTIKDVELFVRMVRYAREAQETERPILATFYDDDGVINLPRMLEGPEWANFELPERALPPGTGEKSQLTYLEYHNAVVAACVELIGEQSREFWDKQCSYEEEFKRGDTPEECALSQCESL